MWQLTTCGHCTLDYGHSSEIVCHSVANWTSVDSATYGTVWHHVLDYVHPEPLCTKMHILHPLWRVWILQPMALCGTTYWIMYIQSLCALSVHQMVCGLCTHLWHVIGVTTCIVQCICALSSTKWAYYTTSVCNWSIDGIPQMVCGLCTHLWHVISVTTFIWPQRWTLWHHMYRSVVRLHHQCVQLQESFTMPRSGTRARVVVHLL